MPKIGHLCQSSNYYNSPFGLIVSIHTRSREEEPMVNIFWFDIQTTLPCYTEHLKEVKE